MSSDSLLSSAKHETSRLHYSTMPLPENDVPEVESGLDKGGSAASSSAPPEEPAEDGHQDPWRHHVLGPSLLMGFASADVGHLLFVTQLVHQDGSLYVAPTALLFLPVYLCAEAVTRLSIYCRKSLFHLVWDDLGMLAAGFFFIIILLSTFGTLLLQVRCLIALGEMVGIDSLLTCLTLTLFHSSLTIASHSHVEGAAIGLGCLELAFVVVFVLMHPNYKDFLPSNGLTEIFDSAYLYSTQTFFGTALVPWLLFFQSSVITRRCLPRKAFDSERTHVAVGSFSALLVKAAVAAAVVVACRRTPPTESCRSEDIVPGPTFLVGMATIGSASVTAMACTTTFACAAVEAYFLTIDRQGLVDLSPRPGAPDLKKLPRGTTAMAELDNEAGRLEAKSYLTKLVQCGMMFGGCLLALSGQVGFLIDFGDMVSALSLLPTLLAALVLSSWKLDGAFRLKGSRRIFLWLSALVLGVCSFYSSSSRVWQGSWQASLGDDGIKPITLDGGTLGDSGPTPKDYGLPGGPILEQDRRFVQPLRYGFAASALMVAQFRFFMH